MLFAGEPARFGHPEQKLGIVTLLGGIHRVAVRAGRARAVEWALTFEPVPASSTGSSRTSRCSPRRWRSRAAWRKAGSRARGAQGAAAYVEGRRRGAARTGADVRRTVRSSRAVRRRSRTPSACVGSGGMPFPSCTQLGDCIVNATELTT
ncbi:hypothetical protein AB0F91_07515 [Amycolatopsis sp. NPDC023774]|uniref:hypothetical protein n=1 Tax=Amycolatopsis sp. NPDC023774 TaxID=3155015 RepID=UPI0033DDEDB2